MRGRSRRGFGARLKREQRVRFRALSLAVGGELTCVPASGHNSPTTHCAGLFRRQSHKASPQRAIHHTAGVDCLSSRQDGLACKSEVSRWCPAQPRADRRRPFPGLEIDELTRSSFADSFPRRRVSERLWPQVRCGLHSDLSDLLDNPHRPPPRLDRLLWRGTRLTIDIQIPIPAAPQGDEQGGPDKTVSQSFMCCIGRGASMPSGVRDLDPPSAPCEEETHWRAHC